MSGQNMLHSGPRLFPPVTTKRFRDAVPGEIVVVLDSGHGQLAMVGSTTGDGRQVPLVVFLCDGSGSGSGPTWSPYDEDQVILSLGTTPFFRFDPAQGAIRSPHAGPIPDGALVVGPGGIRLRAGKVSNYPPQLASAEFDIISGKWDTGSRQHAAAVILSWELVLPQDPMAPHVLFRFQAK